MEDIQILWLIFIIFVVIWIDKHRNKNDKVSTISIIKHDRNIS